MGNIEVFKISLGWFYNVEYEDGSISCGGPFKDQEEAIERALKVAKDRYVKTDGYLL